MSGFTLVKSTLTAVWRDSVPEIGAPNPGTLKTLTATLKGTNPSLNLIDAYGAGLEVIKQWGSYSCF